MSVPPSLGMATATALIALAAAALGCSSSLAEDRAPAGLETAGVTGPTSIIAGGRGLGGGLDGEESAARAYLATRPRPADGIYPAEACNGTLGTCQVLEIEVRGGYVETIFLAGGDHLEIDGAQLAEDGSASGDAYRLDEGYTGDVWNVRIRERGHAGP